MSTFHKHVEGATSSERTASWRATGTTVGIALAFVGTVLLVGPGDAARREAADTSEPQRQSLNSNEISTTFKFLTHVQEDPSGGTSSTADPQPLIPNPSDIGILMDNEQLAAESESLVATTSDLIAIVEPSDLVLPDSEAINSPSSKDFDVRAFVRNHGGFLQEYREQVADIWMNGAEIVEQVARNHSINPRLLLAIIEFQSEWVSDPTRPAGEAFDFPIRSSNRAHQGLYLQLSWTANALSRGYYGWRGENPYFEDVEQRSLAANAGTSAIKQLFAELCSVSSCIAEFMSTYEQLFGDPWENEFELISEDLQQPSLSLPFPGGNEWVFTGGPHGAWGPDAPWAALDFAPKWDSTRRASDKEVVAVADAVVARVDHGVLVLDLDGDGYEQTGWAILYLHVVASEEISIGKWVRQGQIIGEASSAGGVAVGDHLHIARKYDGEWIPAVGPVPFELGPWRARLGAEAYEGELYRSARGCDSIEVAVPVGDSLRSAAPIEVVVSVGDSLKPSALMECAREIFE